jgi:IK cytokine
VNNSQVREPREDPSDIPPRERWFETDAVIEDRSSKSDASQLPKLPSKSHSPPVPASVPDEDEETEQPTRLVPLQSSAIPSIRDLLAMDGAQDKRSKRKDKKKGGKDANPEEKKKATVEAKVDRDYKRLVDLWLSFNEIDPNVRPA